MGKWLLDTIARFNVEKAWDALFGENGFFKAWKFVFGSGAVTMLMGLLQQVPIAIVIAITLLAAAAALHIRNQLRLGDVGVPLATAGGQQFTSKTTVEDWATVGPYGGRFKRRAADAKCEEVVVEITAKKPMRNVKVSLDVWQHTPNISGYGKTKVDRIDLSNTRGRNFDLHRDDPLVVVVHSRTLEGTELSLWGTLVIGADIPVGLRTRIGSTYWVRIRFAHEDGPPVTFPLMFILHNSSPPITEVHVATDNGEEVITRTA